MIVEKIEENKVFEPLKLAFTIENSEELLQMLGIFNASTRVLQTLVEDGLSNLSYKLGDDVIIEDIKNDVDITLTNELFDVLYAHASRSGFVIKSRL